MLKELKKYAHPDDLPKVQSCLDSLVKAALEVNHKQSQIEGVEKLYQLQAMFEGKVVLIGPKRKLIISGNLNEVHGILFRFKLIAFLTCFKLF